MMIKNLPESFLFIRRALYSSSHFFDNYNVLQYSLLLTFTLNNLTLIDNANVTLLCI